MQHRGAGRDILPGSADVLPGLRARRDRDGLDAAVRVLDGNHRSCPGGNRCASHDPVRRTVGQGELVSPASRNILGHWEFDRILNARPGDILVPNRVAVHR